MASHKIITNGSYKKDSGLQCPLTTYQTMQLCLTLSRNTENRRNLAYVSDYQPGHFKNHDQDMKRVHWQINKFVTNHFHRVLVDLVVVRPVKPLFDFRKSIIAAGESRKRSRVALLEDPRFSSSVITSRRSAVPSFSLAT